MTITFLPLPYDVQRWRDGTPKLVRRKPRQWNGWVERRFLKALASTCNVRRSAAMPGVHLSVVYDRRKRYPGFAERWQAALKQGHIELEMALLRGAIATMEGEPIEPESPLPPVTVTQAIMLLRYHDRSVGRRGKRMGREARPLSPAELRESILRKIMAIRRFELMKLEAAMAKLGPLP